MTNDNNSEKILLAILMILTENRELIARKKEADVRNIEMLLVDAGFKGPEIAKIVNKNLAAVQKTIQRARGKNK